MLMGGIGEVEGSVDNNTKGQKLRIFQQRPLQKDHNAKVRKETNRKRIDQDRWRNGRIDG